MDRDQITAEVAARLVAGQFPQRAGLPVLASQLPLPVPEPVGVFSSRDAAIQWVAEHHLTGMITEYPVDIAGPRTLH